MKEKFVNLYINLAHSVAELSHAVRLKVGAVIVNDNTVIFGYNGMPSGWDNTCEHKEYATAEDDTSSTDNWPFIDGDQQIYRLVTNVETLHAESNAISKLARSVVSGENATMFITHSPCIECAKLILQSGIKTVYYETDYRSTAGIEFLKKSNITVIKKAP